jgi:hypothetical protein
MNLVTTPESVVTVVTPSAGMPEGAPVGPVRIDTGPTGRIPVRHVHLRTRPRTHHQKPTDHRSFTMFQALYADLARAHQRRRQREHQRRLEAAAQHEMLVHAPRMLAR